MQGMFHGHFLFAGMFQNDRFDLIDTWGQILYITNNMVHIILINISNDSSHEHIPSSIPYDSGGSFTVMPPTDPHYTNTTKTREKIRGLYMNSRYVDDTIDFRFTARTMYR